MTTPDGLPEATTKLGEGFGSSSMGSRRGCATRFAGMLGVDLSSGWSVTWPTYALVGQVTTARHALRQDLREAVSTRPALPCCVTR